MIEADAVNAYSSSINSSTSSGYYRYVDTNEYSLADLDIIMIFNYCTNWRIHEP